VIQVDAQGVVALWRFRLTGMPALMLVATHDLDHDGQFSPAERKRLAMVMLMKAVSGVQVLWNGTVLAAQSVEPEIADISENALEMLALVRFAPVVIPPGGMLDITVAPTSGDLGVDVQGQQGTRPRPAPGITLTADGLGLVRPVVLTRGQALRIGFEAEK
jgi:hypothetical protein